ncbi:hypothetical protein GB931_04525 [Modestobacter sp. I12A-02628]|uniref:Abi-like protein n=1 Tax=Goekera deserti TaxID=2497753 RepID=A0A7K3WDX6_9ACTN|nr:hypothetical protein [Goekera deserti]MPQ97203.1 hypothetical protein [Goekera deserti]NDI46479.1 hypothetical protein [Goekera deserti]NEL54587.1 hypothetical protein [Goekera deserti]
MPCLHRAFPPGTDRATDVDGPVGRLQQLRNGLAHHEHLLATDVAARLADLTAIAGLISPDLGGHLTATSQVSTLLTRRPADT